nr:MAG TPA: hypothetical protein [Caudoviricetes sp.]
MKHKIYEENSYLFFMHIAYNNRYHRENFINIIQNICSKSLFIYTNNYTNNKLIT